MTYDQEIQNEQRVNELQRLRALRRSKARGEFNWSANEVLANPLLPPWMTPSSLETASPLGVDLSNFTGMDVRETKRPRPNREYPSSIGALGSNY